MITSVFRKILCPIFAVFVLIMNFSEKTPENFVKPVRTESFVLTDALERGQGVTTDGKYYYFSGNYFLIKTTMNGFTLIRNREAIPFELLKKGCDHIGGISYLDGYIYASVEDSGSFQNLYLLKFDADTLRCVKYEKMPSEYHEKGAPWVVADSGNGIIYSARCDDIQEMNMYSSDSLKFLGTFPLSKSSLRLDNIQGGEIYDNIMYLSVSHGNHEIYAVNMKTGETVLALSRNLPEKSEGEDMTVFHASDGSFFHVLDIGSVRVGCHLRHYAFDPDTIKWSLS